MRHDCIRLIPKTLERTNRKFIARFNHIEQRAHELGTPLKDMTLAQMDALWNEAKAKGL